METEERNLTKNKYWTTIDGERYLQVEEVDDEVFRNTRHSKDGDDDEDKKEKL